MLIGGNMVFISNNVVLLPLGFTECLCWFFLATIYFVEAFTWTIWRMLALIATVEDMNLIKIMLSMFTGALLSLKISCWIMITWWYKFCKRLRWQNKLLIYLPPVILSVFTCRDGSQISVPKQWNGGHVGVPNQSCGSWTLFLCKNFLLFQ